jgi:hypothetical protein
MTQVFWLMWLSDVVGNVGFVGGAAVLVCGFALLFALIAALVTEDREPINLYFKYAKWALIPIAIACIVPDKSTIRVMAVASAADAASKTQLGAKGLEAIDALLDRVITEAKKK